MNLWRIEKLKDELANQTISQRNLFIYYLIVGISLAFLMFPGGIDLYDDYQGLSFKWIEWVTTTLIYLLGLFVCYKVNKGNLGKSFIDRIVSLEVVLAIRYLVFLYAPLTIIWLIFLDGTNYSDFALLFNSVVFEFVLIIRLILCLKEITRFK